MRPIFVSYRRDDTEGEAGRLFDDLVSRFGEDSVFLDVAAIEVGRDFRKAIDESVGTCGVLLAVIGKGWVDAKNEAGDRRLDDPFDFVRIETASALKRDIPVIPVLVHGAKMPRADQLPEDLKELTYRNGVELTHARWRSDLELLIKSLNPYVDPKPITPTPAPVPPEELEGKNKSAKVTTGHPSNSRRAIFTSVLCAFLLAAGVYWLLPTQRTVPDLMGSTLSDATLKLRAASLVVGREDYKPDSTKNPDTVLSQVPLPNARVKSGTAVDLLIAKQASLVEVPRLKGRSLADAERALQGLHLTVGQVSQETKSRFAANTVLSESPSSGRKVNTGTAIDLVVAQAAPPPGPSPIQQGSGAGSTVSQQPKESGPIQRTVPDLTGGSLSDATLKLQGESLAVGKISRQPTSIVAENTVLSEFPASGIKVEPGTAIDLVVAQMPAAVPPQGSSQPQTGSVIGSRAAVTQRTRVNSGTAIDSVGAQMPAASAQGLSRPQMGSVIGSRAAALQPKGQTPNFAGTWQLSAMTLNGVPQNLLGSRPLVVTQNGTTVSIFNRELQINPSGTIGYQTFTAHDDKSRHEVATAAQADLVNTISFRLEGSMLMEEAIADYRKQLDTHPPGKEVRIFSYRRVAP